MSGESGWPASVCWRSRNARSSAGNDPNDSPRASLRRWHQHRDPAPRVPKIASRSSQAASLAGTTSTTRRSSPTATFVASPREGGVVPAWPEAGAPLRRGRVRAVGLVRRARRAGRLHRAQAIVTSALVFAGSAQFTALAIVAGGGGIGAALSAATLMHSRFLAMGIALAPSLPGGPLRRAVEGQAVVDASWALANRGDGTFDRYLLFGTTAAAVPLLARRHGHRRARRRPAGRHRPARPRRAVPHLLRRHPASPSCGSRGPGWPPRSARRSRWRWCRSPRPASRCSRRAPPR